MLFFFTLTRKKSQSPKRHVVRKLHFRKIIESNLSTTTIIMELNDLYSSPNIVRVIKSRRMRWAEHVERMGEERGRIGSWWGNRTERDHWGDLGVDGWIILGWISRRWDVGMWTGLG